MNQPELGVEVVEVKHALRPGLSDETRSLVALDEFEAGAGLHAAQDTDESFEQTAFAGDLVSEIVLALSPFEETVRGAFGVGQVLGVCDDAFGLFLGELEEVLAFDLEDVIDEALQVGPVPEGEVALEENAVKAGKARYNEGGEFSDKADDRFHGVLLQGVSSDNTILTAERRVCFSSLVAALPR